MATKLYQTSSSAVPEQPARDCVAKLVFPDVDVVHVAVPLTVKAVAVRHSLLTGGTGICEVNEILSIAAGGCVPKLPSFVHSKTNLTVVPA